MLSLFGWRLHPKTIRWMDFHPLDGFPSKWMDTWMDFIRWMVFGWTSIRRIDFHMPDGGFIHRMDAPYNRMDSYPYLDETIYIWMSVYPNGWMFIQQYESIQMDECLSKNMNLSKNKIMQVWMATLSATLRIILIFIPALVPSPLLLKFTESWTHECLKFCKISDFLVVDYWLLGFESKFLHYIDTFWCTRLLHTNFINVEAYFLKCFVKFPITYCLTQSILLTFLKKSLC